MLTLARETWTAWSGSEAISGESSLMLHRDRQAVSPWSSRFTSTWMDVSFSLQSEMLLSSMQRKSTAIASISLNKPWLALAIKVTLLPPRGMRLLKPSHLHPPVLTPHIFVTWALHHCSCFANQPITLVPMSGMQFCWAYELLLSQLLQIRKKIYNDNQKHVDYQKKKNQKKKTTKNSILNTQRISGSLNSFNVSGIKRSW